MTRGQSAVLMLAASEICTSKAKTVMLRHVISKDQSCKSELSDRVVNSKGWYVRVRMTSTSDKLSSVQKIIRPQLTVNGRGGGGLVDG